MAFFLNGFPVKMPVRLTQVKIVAYVNLEELFFGVITKKFYPGGVDINQVSSRSCDKDNI